MNQDIATLAYIFNIKELLMNELKIIFEKAGLNSTEVFIIYLLHHDKKEFRAGDLAARLYLPMSTLTGIVDKMIEKGLILRKHSEEDRRVVIIELHPQFRERSAHYMVDLVSLMKDISGGFEPEWYEDFNDRLKTFKETLEKRAQA